MTKALYIHIPFCNHICGYCDFVRVGYQSSIADRYLIELRKDLKNITENISSIYIGGGTPSSLSTDQLELLFDSLNHLQSSDQEITFEANPESLSLDKIKLLKRNGVNRISLGVQSTQDSFLQSLDRQHSYMDVLNVIQQLEKEGISNVSLDFMYGIPNQKLTDLDTDLKAILDLKPNHISLYSLTIEPNSAFGKRGLKEAPVDLETQMYVKIQEILNRNGYSHYEISNYCKEGYESKHNLAYWHYEDFIGLGIGASSKVGNSRWTNSASLQNYLKGQRDYSQKVFLDSNELAFEHLMMSLRLSTGIHLQSFNQTHQVNFLNKYQKVTDQFIGKNYLKIENGYLFATDTGRLMLHDILVEYMDDN